MEALSQGKSDRSEETAAASEGSRTCPSIICSIDVKLFILFVQNSHVQYGKNIV